MTAEELEKAQLEYQEQFISIMEESEAKVIIIDENVVRFLFFTRMPIREAVAMYQKAMEGMRSLFPSRIEAVEQRVLDESIPEPSNDTVH